MTQESFLYQVYHDESNLLVGQHVVIFDGALGQQTLDRWDPTPFGHYANTNDCQWGGDATNAECNYDRVRHDLIYNGFSEKQVQAVFLKSSTSFPQCDLKGLYCAAGAMPDAYLSEIYLGDILRYLKCCKLDDNGESTGVPRYANLKQVFLTSRTYGGYANGTPHGCLSPEPFAYEEGIAVQRTIVAQINQSPGYPPIEYAGHLGYDVAPWVDWGPYLWTNGELGRSDGVKWCNRQGDAFCALDQHDVRYGDPDMGYEAYWGDFTHPTAQAEKKVADQLVQFINKDTGSAWIRPWVVK